MGGCREKLNYSVVERGDLGHQLASGFAGSGVLPYLLLGTCPCPYSIPSEVTVPTGPQNLCWNRPLTSECLSKMTGPHMRAVGSRQHSFYDRAGFLIPCLLVYSVRKQLGCPRILLRIPLCSVLSLILLWALGAGGVLILFLRTLTSSRPLSYPFQTSVPGQNIFPSSSCLVETQCRI